MNDLKPCPFCREEDIRVEGGDITCSACGPFRGMGIQQWNLRAPRFSTEEREAMDVVLGAASWWQSDGDPNEDVGDVDKAAAVIRKMLTDE